MIFGPVCPCVCLSAITEQVAQLWQRDRTTRHDFKGVGHFEAKF